MALECRGQEFLSTIYCQNETIKICQKDRPRWKFAQQENRTIGKPPVHTYISIQKDTHDLLVRAVVRAWAAWAQAHVLKWLIAEKMQKMGYFHCIFLIWPTSCEKPNDGPA